MMHREISYIVWHRISSERINRLRMETLAIVIEFVRSMLNSADFNDVPGNLLCGLAPVV